ncbi:MAG: GNAT family N-acetyltransferase [Solirubrobacteraceae bacterium]
MSITVIRYAERPELWRDTEALSRAAWPEYNLHGPVLGRYWNRLIDDFPAYQFVLFDEDQDEVLAEGHTLPCPWDGTADGLGDGIDAITVAAFEAAASGREPTALCAMAAEIDPRFQGRGLADGVLEAMSQIAREARLTNLIAPVRPSFKDRYPITPIERYVTWTRENGEPFDPWVRVHTRRGGQIVKPIPQSLLITGTVGEWEQWTGLKFPESGEYTFPAGLAPVDIDRAQDLGTYWEPNVWIVHPVG